MPTLRNKQTLALQICRDLVLKVSTLQSCKQCVCVVCKLPSLRHLVLADGIDSEGIGVMVGTVSPTGDPSAVCAYTELLVTGERAWESLCLLGGGQIDGVVYL